jgi:serine/threonine protein kinase
MAVQPALFQVADHTGVRTIGKPCAVSQAVIRPRRCPAPIITSSLALTPGTRLGPYEILSAIGAGGMGEVYRARDTRLDRIVAIKILPDHLADRADLRERFEREARTIASLNHSHICTSTTSAIRTAPIIW